MFKDNLADNDDSSSTTTETSNPDVETNIKEEPVKKKGRSVIPTKEKDESSAFILKPKPKKQVNSKKENQPEKSSSLELPYKIPQEKGKNFQSKALHPLPNFTKSRPLQKTRPDGKSEEGRPSLLVKMLSGSSVPELGHSSSSEGEKEFASPEWDIPENNIPGSLQQISLQTINADPFLKRANCSPPPTSPSLLSRGTYSSVLNNDMSQKKAPGCKLPVAPPLPGKNGNPTFAAVAAGYDKSPGGSGPGKSLNPMTSVESDSSDSSGLWSPIDGVSPGIHSNSFSAFGPNNNFNLTGVFSGMNLPKSSEPQPQTWPDFTPVSSSIWDVPSSDPLHSWPSSSGSPTAPTASLLGSVRNPWISTTPTVYGSSIWSTSADSALNPFPSTTGGSSSPLTSDLVPGPAPSSPSSPTELSRTFNPWNIWGPMLSRRSSEPWPTSPSNANSAENNSGNN